MGEAGEGQQDQDRRGQGADAETAPLTDPEAYRYDIDIARVSEVWRRGSVIASWLLDLAAAALRSDPALEGFAGRVSDSGEGRWSALAAAVALAAALAFRTFRYVRPPARPAAGPGPMRRNASS
mgnify:CR=1 FL=1